MIVLSGTDITKEYGKDLILDHVSFHISQGQRIGIVGANGAGKTTLLNILSGELPCNGGGFFIGQNQKIGYLKQTDIHDSEETVLETVEKIFLPLKKLEEEMSRITMILEETVGEEQQEKLIGKYDELSYQFESEGGYTYRSEIRGILKGMAFSEEAQKKQVNALSGGEKTRLSLAMLLLEKPSILFLDEPTNHLDIGTLKWLEQYLSGYKGTILMVSHDRYFLDQVANGIFEIENHKLTKYHGNYSYYVKEKQMMREHLLRTVAKQEKERAKQEEIIRRFKGHGTEKLAKRAASRERKLEKLEPIERPDKVAGKMKLHFSEKYKSGEDVLLGQDIGKSFGYGRNKVELFHHVNFDIKRGEKICIVGPNGIGKTTLMGMILGEVEPNAGRIKRGHNVNFAYYDQQQKLLEEDNTAFEEIRNCEEPYSDTEIRSILGQFLFKGDEVFLPIKTLSGGEKARLSLLKMMMSGANVLLMDEPTNHLDIQSKEVFEEALSTFPGTVIAVSHDRYFLSKIPTKIVELKQTGLNTFIGKYDYYIEKKKEIKSGEKYLEELNGKEQEKVKETTTEKTTARNRREKKEREAIERRNLREKEKAEDEISFLEDKISCMEEEMCQESVIRDYGKLMELDHQLEESKEKLAKAYEKWLQYDQQ